VERVRIRTRSGTRPTGLAISDLDKNGAGDIVVACATEGRVVVVRNRLSVRSP